MNRPPDFIIIGAMKCATSTLHEQLARQPGIFMSTPKEPNYFSDDEQWSRGRDWYASVFRDAPALCGESSTHYTKLPTYPTTVERMREVLPPSTKFVYVMRHPIDRLVSQYIHEWTQRVISCGIDQAVERHPELVEYSRYAMQLTPFVDAFGSQAILPVFFERLRSSEQSELERICRFLGYQDAPQWSQDLGARNVSSDRMRGSVVRDALVNAPLLSAIRRHVIPQLWRDRIKRLWTMNRRPELSDHVVRRLEATFDGDLEILNSWFGLELNCGNFREVAAKTTPQWVDPLERAA